MASSKNSVFDLFVFFDRTPDLVCIAGKDGFFKKVNFSVIDKLGYSEEELFASPIASFIYAEDRDITHSHRASLLAGKVLHNFVNRYVAKNGLLIWLEWTSVYFSDEEIVFAIAKDVTERKKIEKESEEEYKKFKSLASYFKNSIEKDRKYFAYELHEEVAQLAAAIKLSVNWIANNMSELNKSSKSRVEHVGMVSELLIKKIQKISFSISPNMLDYFGLKDTLEWLCHDFANCNNINCVFENTFDEAGLTHEMKIDFFRICQESLANVVAHAQASNVKISVEDIDDRLGLTIIDDGKGFNIDEQKHASGFVSMQGRVTSLNGQLTIQSEPGKGTKICITVPKVTITESNHLPPTR